MVHCNNYMQIEVHPDYDFTTDEWFRLPEAEMIKIREESTQYKMSLENENKTLVSEITTGSVQDDIRSIHQIISAIESNTGDGQSRASRLIMEGKN